MRLRNSYIAIKNWAFGNLLKKDPAIVPIDHEFPEMTGADRETLALAAPYTQTSPARLYALTQAVRHIHRHGIEGAVVECGVWRGGSMMAAARTLVQLGSSSRDLYLFDTFAGMSAPTDVDKTFFGVSAKEYMKDPLLNVVPLAEVQACMRTTGYPEQKIHYVKGKVEDTLPGQAPEKIALLRLDTDWYESTKHELLHLFPRLVPNGVVIIDDYGHFEGCRKAVDEYFADLRLPVLLQRIDYTGRMAIKPPPV